jgi:hypothetical protein
MSVRESTCKLLKFLGSDSDTKMAYTLTYDNDPGGWGNAMIIYKFEVDMQIISPKSSYELNAPTHSNRIKQRHVSTRRTYPIYS